MLPSRFFPFNHYDSVYSPFRYGTNREPRVSCSGWDMYGTEIEFQCPVSVGCCGNRCCDDSMFQRDRYRYGYDRYLEPVISPSLVYEQSLPFGPGGPGQISNADRLIAKAVNNPSGLAAEAIKAEYELETLHIVLISLAILLVVLVVVGGAFCVKWRINRRRNRAISTSPSGSSGATSGSESENESRNGRRSKCYRVACI